MKAFAFREDIRQILHKSRQDMVLTQATALAYTSLLSLVPILAVAFFLFHAFGGFDDLLERLQPLIEQNLAPSFSTQISQYVENFVNNVHAGTIGVFGIIGFIFTAISTLATIERTFNLIFGTSRARGMAKRVTTYWSLLTIGPLLVGVSLAVTSKALTWLKDDHGVVAQLLLWGYELLPYAATGLLFTALYMFMPNVTVDKRDAAKAGFITGIVFEIAKIVYALYARRSLSHSAVYGSLVIIPVFLVWLYLVWLIVLYGAELCCYFQFKRLGIPYRFNVEDRLNPFVVVDIIETLGSHQEGPRGGLTLPRLIEKMRMPMRELMRHLDFLESEGWVVASAGNFFTGGSKYYLAVPRGKIQMEKIFEMLENRRYVPTSDRGLLVYKKFRGLWTGH